MNKTAQYEEVMTHLRGLLDGETDEVAAHGGTGGILDSFGLCANNGAS
jgi:hypothetical protein